MYHYRMIDFCRSIAAIVVAILHWQIFMTELDWGNYASGDSIQAPMPVLLGPIYEYGYFAVQYFWMISGFIFASVYGASKIGFYEFGIRRLARLYPLALLTLLIVAVLQGVVALLLGHTIFYPVNDAYHFLLNFFLASSWGFEEARSFNGPIWSVSAEIPVYAFFWCCIRSLPMNAFTCFVLAVVFFKLQGVMPFNHINSCGMHFFLGAGVFYLTRQLEPLPLALLSVLTWVVGLAAMIVVPEIQSVISLVLFLAFGPLIAFLCAVDQTLTKEHGLLDRMAGFGDLSYAIYLLHFPILLALTVIMICFGIDREILSDSLTAMLLYLVVTIWVSHQSFVKIESPARRWLCQVLAPTQIGRRARPS